MSAEEHIEDFLDYLDAIYAFFLDPVISNANWVLREGEAIFISYPSIHACFGYTTNVSLNCAYDLYCRPIKLCSSRMLNQISWGLELHCKQHVTIYLLH